MFLLQEAFNSAKNDFEPCMPIFFQKWMFTEWLTPI